MTPLKFCKNDMKILMISIDKGLLGSQFKKQLGDTVERHIKYGEKVGQLDIIVFSGKGFNQYNLSDKVRAYPTNSKNKAKYFFDGLKLGKKLFGKNQYDLIVTQEPFITGLTGVKLKKKFGAKLLVHFHGDFWQNQSWLKESKLNSLFLTMSGYVVPRADAIRVVSNGIKEKLIKAGIKAEKIFVIPTPVNLKKYDRPDLDGDKEYKMVLHVSRYDKVKDFKTLGEVFSIISKQIDNIKFLQIGGGDKAKQYLSGGKVEVTGLLNHQALVKYFYQADVLVLSSTSESFGKVLVEANACGKPVVATATTGAKEVIKDGYNGYIVPIGDAQALAEKTIELLKNPVKAKEMGANGQKLVQEKYGDNLNEVIKLWQEVVTR